MVILSLSPSFRNDNLVVLMIGTYSHLKARESQWNGNLFIGALAGKHLNRLVIEDNIVVEEERLYQGLGRFRQIIQGPDGYIYFIAESPSKLYRITQM